MLVDSGLRAGRAGFVLAVLLAGLAAPAAGEVVVRGDPARTSVSVVRRTEIGYYLVTGSRPLEFDATGPDWLRVYTRLWWPAGATGNQSYRLALWQEDVERPVEFEAGVSGSSYGPNRRKVGAWRSFFVQVPPGNSRYRLVLDRAVSDTVAVRVVRQKPRPWEPVGVAGRELDLVEGRDTLRFHELMKGKPLPLELVGPGRVRVRSRLSFDPTMSGTQGFVITASDGGKQIARRSLRAARAAAASYSNEPMLVPSAERTVSFALSEGSHRLNLVLSGTLARSAAVRIEFLPGEKYE